MAVAKGSKFESFLAVVVGGGAAFGLVVITSRAWKTCYVDVAGKVPNGLTLLFLGLPLALIVNLILFTVVFRYSGKSFLTALFATAIAIAIADLALFSWQGTPAASPGICPGNVPPWWPTWIPT
jgi:FtsH-binding integral membrane protein